MSKTKFKDLSVGKKIGRIISRFFAGILCLIILFLGITTAITYIGYAAQLSFIDKIPDAGCKKLNVENYAPGCWNIKSDEPLKVMQLTDIHIGAGWLSISRDTKAITAVASMITAEKPDLVIVTGDIAFPVPHRSGTLNNVTSAKLFEKLMDKLGVYWTLAYGNHDDEMYSLFHYSKINNIYENSKNPRCLFQVGPTDIDGYGNQVINIKNSDGIITRSLFLLDSHSYTDDDKFGYYWRYDNIHQNQIDWYEKTLTELNETNKNNIKKLPSEKQAEYDISKPFKSSLFFHIPLKEYRNAWHEFADNDYKDTQDSQFQFGKAGENGDVVFCGYNDDNLFETAQKLGSTDSTFCGHDHYNNFSIKYKGVQLTYGMSIDYLAYAGISKMGSQRGCNIINYGKNGEYSVSQENYYQDKYQNYLGHGNEDITLQYEGIDGYVGVNRDPRG